MQDEMGAGTGCGYFLYSRTPASERLEIQVYARGKLFASLDLVEWSSHSFGKEPDFSMVFPGFFYYGFGFIYFYP